MRSKENDENLKIYIDEALQVTLNNYCQTVGIWIPDKKWQKAEIINVRKLDVLEFGIQK